MNSKRLKLIVLSALAIAGCRDNPFGKEIYKGKVIDATTGKGISGARVEVRAKEMFKGPGYTTEGLAVTDENGNYSVSYERERKHSYLVYAFKEQYSEDDNYAWGDRKRTDIKLNPFAYVKIRAINQSHLYESASFDVSIDGIYAEISNCEAHPDTVMGNFPIPGNVDFELRYHLSGKNGDYDTRKVSLKLQEFEVDSICVVY